MIQPEHAEVRPRDILDGFSSAVNAAYVERLGGVSMLDLPIPGSVEFDAGPLTTLLPQDRLGAQAALVVSDLRRARMLDLLAMGSGPLSSRTWDVLLTGPNSEASEDGPASLAVGLEYDGSAYRSLRMSVRQGSSQVLYHALWASPRVVAALNSYQNFIPPRRHRQSMRGGLLVVRALADVVRAATPEPS
jgi:hypothetical protein